MNKPHNEPILVVTATEREVEPLLKVSSFIERNSVNRFRIAIGDHTVDILITGVGIPLCTFELSTFLANHKVPIAIHIGIAGSYIKDLLKGEVVQIVEDEFGDLGLENGTGFRTLMESGFIGSNEFPFSDSRLVNQIPAGILLPDGIKKVRGITINLVTSNMELIQTRHLKSKAEVETMESAAFFYCCLKTITPFISIRGISNRVGEEDKSKWLIREAIQNSCDVLIDILQKNNFFRNET